MIIEIKQENTIKINSNLFSSFVLKSFHYYNYNIFLFLIFNIFFLFVCNEIRLNENLMQRKMGGYNEMPPQRGNFDTFEQIYNS